MKHNELLDKIYWHWRRDNSGADGLQPMVDYRRALLEIAYLHYQSDEVCRACPTYNYPCPTIQVIEKTLGTTHLVEHTSSFSTVTTTSYE